MSALSPMRSSSVDASVSRNPVMQEVEAAFDAWTVATRTVARKLTESTLETGPLRDEILRLAGSE